MILLDPIVQVLAVANANSLQRSPRAILQTALRIAGFPTALVPTPFSADHARRAGAPYTYVTTSMFLSHFGFDTLRDLPDFEALEDAGLLSKDKLLTDNVPHEHTDDEAIDAESHREYTVRTQR